VLLPLLRACSFRLVNGAARATLPLGLGSVAPLLPPAPPPPFGIAPPPVANSQPKQRVTITLT